MIVKVKKIKEPVKGTKEKISQTSKKIFTVILAFTWCERALEDKLVQKGSL